MDNKFFDKVLRERIVDTKQYRYTVKERNDADGQHIEIVRLPISSLNTTAAIDGWETVKVY